MCGGCDVTDLYHSLGNPQGEAESYRMHDSFSQMLLKDHFQSTQLTEHQLIQVTAPFPCVSDPLHSAATPAPQCQPPPCHLLSVRYKGVASLKIPIPSIPKGLPSLRNYCKKKKRRFSHRQLGPLHGSSSPFQHFEPARVKPN